MYRTFFKRLLDISLSGCAIVILSPLLLIIAVAIKIDDPGPVLFRQKRVGIHKTHFSIMKFRTMKMDTPKGHTHPSAGKPGAVYHEGGKIPAEVLPGRAAPDLSDFHGENVYYRPPACPVESV